MAGARKDAVEVATFRGLFARLRDWIDDEPSVLAHTAAQDEGVDKLCSRLNWAADALRRMERSKPSMFAAPADPAFIREWRDFEARYEEAVEDVASRWLWELIKVDDAGSAVGARAHRRWNFADSMAEEAAGGIERALGFARDQIEQEHREFADGFVEEVEDGLGEWERLKAEAGFDLRGVIRRRRLIPFVLVPRHVAAKYGISDKASLLTNLRAAHDAFVFGAPLAALAMMRSILEVVLRDHYGAEGADLNERINRAQRLPKGAPREALHRVRERGNVVLHLNQEKVRRLPDLDAVEKEEEIVSLLMVLRTLIEEAPGADEHAGLGGSK